MLLLLLSLGQFTGADDLGWRRTVWLDRLGEEHADLLLVKSILGVFARSDQLSQPCRTLEKQDQEPGASKSVAVKGVRGIATPLVKYKPDHLLRKEVGMSAVRPKTGSEKASVEINLLETIGHLRILLILIFRGLIICVFD